MEQSRRSLHLSPFQSEYPTSFRATNLSASFPLRARLVYHELGLNSSSQPKPTQPTQPTWVMDPKPNLRAHNPGAGVLDRQPTSHTHCLFTPREAPHEEYSRTSRHKQRERLLRLPADRPRAPRPRTPAASGFGERVSARVSEIQRLQNEGSPARLALTLPFVGWFLRETTGKAKKNNKGCRPCLVYPYLQAGYFAG